MLDLKELLAREEKRQTIGFELIPSENIMFPECREVLSSVLTNKYSEGYPGKRYYAGNFIVDEIERQAIENVKNLFGLEHANLQPHSGSPANLAIASALAGVNGRMLSQHLFEGGHLSMGQEASITSKIFQVDYYTLTPDGDINWEELEKKAHEFRPAVIWAGGTGFTRQFDFARYAAIAEAVSAWFVADISHIGGLIAGGAHPSPVKHAHVIMSTTHKTLRGPWGAFIGVTKRGIEKDPDLPAKIDKAVFPGLQGGPHMANVAAIGKMAELASKDEFKEYATQIVVNAQSMADVFMQKGYELVGGGTQNHMIWINLTNKGIEGYIAHIALEAAGLYTNKQTVPGDTRSPFYPSGLRLGTPVLTTRGMKQEDVAKLAELIDEGIMIGKSMFETRFSDIGNPDKERDQKARSEFKKAVWEEKALKDLSKKVEKLAQKFPLKM